MEDLLKYLIVSTMKHDDLRLITRNDALLLLYGSVMLQTKEKDRHAYIKYGLRVLGRTLVEYRKGTNLENAIYLFVRTGN